MDLRRTVYSKEHSEMIEIIVLAFLDHHLVEKRLLVYENYARDCNRLFAFDEYMPNDIYLLIHAAHTGLKVTIS